MKNHQYLQPSFPPCKELRCGLAAVSVFLGIALAVPAVSSAGAPDGSPPPPVYELPPAATTTDAVASLRELAVLSSFGFSIRDTQKGQPRFVLSPLTALAQYPYPPHFSDVLIRLTRLAKSQDADVGAAAKRLRPLMTASYQLNFVNALRGNTAANQGSRYSELMNSSLAWAHADYLDHKQSEPRLAHIDGRQVMVPGEPYEQSAETRQRFEDFVGSYEGVFSELKEMKSVSYAVDIARAPLHREAAEIWAKTLFPRLAGALPATASNATLAEVRQVLKFDAPLPLKQLWAYGMITFGNPRATLTNATARVQLQNEFGERGDWYVHLPVLRPGQYVQMALPSTIFRSAPLSLKIDATFSLICDQGRMMDVVVDTGKKSNDGRSIEEVRIKDRQLSSNAERLTPLLPKIAPVCAEPDVAAQGLIERFGRGRSYTARSKTAAYLMETGTFDLTARTVTLRVTETNSDTPRSYSIPGRLIAEVERGVVLGFTSAGFSAESHRPGIPVSTRQPSVRPSPAPGVPPLGTGSSLRIGGLQPSSSLGGVGATKLPGRSSAILAETPTTIPQSSTASDVDNRPPRLVTSPNEIMDALWYKRAKKNDALKANTALMIITGEMQVRDLGLLLHSNEPTMEAEFVLYVDHDRNPWVQIRTLNEDTMRHLPLFETKVTTAP